MKTHYSLIALSSLMLAVAPAGAFEPEAEVADAPIQLGPETVLGAVDIDHLRAFAVAFEFEPVFEQVDPDTVVLAMRQPEQPVFNLIATACQSEDKLSDCKALIVRSLVDPEGSPFDPALAHRLNDEFAVTKTMILPDGRLQMDRLVILGGGVTVDNIAENIATSYGTFIAAKPLIFPEPEAEASE